VAYFALIASRHRCELILDNLVATGMPANKLENVRAPAGLDPGATTPEKIARIATARTACIPCLRTGC
jgi:xanthine dehydrogenase accessory factor